MNSNPDLTQGAIGSVIGIDPFGVSPGMEEMKQRKPNFTESEKFFLVRQYEEYKGVLSLKGGDSSVYRTKNQVWLMITDELNRRNPAIQRTVPEIRKKWQNLVATARKEVKDAESRGLPPNHLPFLWRKVVELCEDDIFGTEDSNYEQMSTEKSSSTSKSPLHETGGQAFVKEEPSEWLAASSFRPTSAGLPENSLPSKPLSDQDTTPEDAESAIRVHSETEYPLNGTSQRSASTNQMSSVANSPSPFNFAPSFGALSGLPTLPFHKQQLVSVPPQKRRYQELKSRPSDICDQFQGNSPDEKWSIEKASKLQAMKQSEEKHDLEQKKLKLEVEILELQRRKLETELLYLQEGR